MQLIFIYPSYLLPFPFLHRTRSMLIVNAILLFHSNKQGCSKPCKETAWKGDKTCDDDNNHCGCGWDGGDCCGTTKDYDYLYCNKCKCLDPKNQPKVKPGEVCNLNFKGDTHCDPQNNHANCDFDGGDCCGPTKSGKSGRSKYHFCTAKDILKDGACTCKVSTCMSERLFNIQCDSFNRAFIQCIKGPEVQVESQVLHRLLCDEVGW